MKQYFRDIIAETAHPPVTPEVVALPGPCATSAPLPPVEGGDALSIYPSGNEWEEGDEDVEMALEPSVLTPVEPLEVVVAEARQPLAPTPKVPGFSGQQVSDGILFPLQRLASARLMGDTMPDLLKAVESEVPLTLTSAPGAALATPSLRKFLSGGKTETVPATKRFLVDVSVRERLRFWSRGSSKDWTSYSRTFNQEVQVSDSDYLELFKSPVIPDDVWTMLQNPQQGAPKASQSETKGYKLKDASAHRREESLRALDRSLRAGVKYQSLAVWSVEGLGAVLRTHPSRCLSVPLPCFKAYQTLWTAQLISWRAPRSKCRGREERTSCLSSVSQTRRCLIYAGSPTRARMCLRDITRRCCPDRPAGRRCFATTRSWQRSHFPHPQQFPLQGGRLPGIPAEPGPGDASRLPRDPHPQQWLLQVLGRGRYR